MKILLCDDHAVFRSGLRLVAESLDADAEVIETQDGEGALEVAAQHPDLDLVLLDLELPGIDGHEGLRRFRERLPSLPVVIVSADDDPMTIRRALDAGASGHIPKGASEREMVSALRLILEGGVYVPPAALAAPARPAGASGGDGSDRAARLTSRQREVLSLMARGLTNREICGVLSIAEGTVKTHVAAILEALDVTNRTEAAVRARELGLKADGEE